MIWAIIPLQAGAVYCEERSEMYLRTGTIMLLSAEIPSYVAEAD
jgi:hypothetical protein